MEVPTEKRVKRWALSMEELMSDPTGRNFSIALIEYRVQFRWRNTHENTVLPATGLQEFTNYLRKEYSHENIRFWLAVKDLRHSSQAQIPDKVNEIFRYALLRISSTVALLSCVKIIDDPFSNPQRIPGAWSSLRD